jgi:hypothetical protein
VVQIAVIGYPRVPDPLIIQSEHGSFWQLLAHRAGSSVAGILNEVTRRFDPVRSGRVS